MEIPPIDESLKQSVYGISKSKKLVSISSREMDLDPSNLTLGFTSTAMSKVISKADVILICIIYYSLYIICFRTILS